MSKLRQRLPGPTQSPHNGTFAAVNALKNGITKATKEIEELVPEIARIAEELSHLTLQPAKRCVSI